MSERLNPGDYSDPKDQQFAIWADQQPSDDVDFARLRQLRERSRAKFAREEKIARNRRLRFTKWLHDNGRMEP